MKARRNGIPSLLREYQFPLWAGMVLALVLANVNYSLYHSVIGTHTMHFIVNEYFMAYFFGRAAKEVWEAIVSPTGALSSIKKAASPLMATVGGFVVPFGITFVGGSLMGISNVLQVAVVPTATDIVFSRVALQLSIGNANGIGTFLTTLALTDDGLGLGAIALLFSEEVKILPLVLLTGGAIITGFICNRRGIRNHWVYHMLMHVSWAGLWLGGLPPALGFVFVIPMIPHAYNGDKYFDIAEEDRPDTLDKWAHFWHLPIDLGLFIFALVNCGVPLGQTQYGGLFWLLLLAVVIGKPLGVVGFSLIGTRYFGFELPEGMDLQKLTVVGFAAGIGLTVMLFVSQLAFQSEVQLFQATAAALGTLVVSGTVAFIIGRFRFSRLVKSYSEA